MVGETNDSRLNDIQGRHVKKVHVMKAINNAKSGPVIEGSVGAGAGTRAFGYKGGIGTSSRILPKEAGGFTVGVLVQTNFGGSLMINGAPVGRELKKSPFSSNIPYDEDEGSCMIVIATDAPLSNRNLKRMAKRVDHALGSVGAYSPNGSGDYAIIFSTSKSSIIFIIFFGIFYTIFRYRLFLVILFSIFFVISFIIFRKPTMSHHIFHHTLKTVYFS